MEFLPMELVTLSGDQLVTDSMRVAQHFGKRHDDVLRAVRRLESPADFNRRNFAEIDYKDARGRRQPLVQMTKDGFMFLTMGFGGAQAARIKVAYIEAFNQMAAQLERRDLTLIVRLLEHELRDKDSRQRGQIHGKGLANRRKEKHSLEKEEDLLKLEAQPTLFELARQARRIA